MKIKFRGMCANGIMRYGRLSQDKENSTLYYKEYSQRICWDNSNIPVSNKTLGQFTGLKDKNGKEIFEGDVLKFKFTDCEKDKENFIIVECIFQDGRFLMDEIEKKDLACYYYFEDELVEVIGNIYENPELLEEGK